MKFFIDTANLDQIREAHDLGVLDGVTTNPSLMAKEGIKGVENQRRHFERTTHGGFHSRSVDCRWMERDSERNDRRL